jgi:outer membrane protein
MTPGDGTPDSAQRTWTTDTWMIKTIKSLTLITALLMSLTAQAETLWEIYEQATRSDPAIREAEANMQAQMQAKPQARAALLPQINAQAGYDQTMVDGDQPNNLGTQVPIKTETKSTQWGFGLSQTLFNTDEWRTLKRADKEVARATVDYQAAQQDLMLRVSVSYFDVLAAQDQLVSEQAAKDAIARQLEQAERRFEVGLIAITDVKESQAGYDDAVALEIAAKRQLATAKEALREITGVYPQTLAAPAAEFPLIPPDPQIEQDWVDVSLEQNLALESAKIGAEITRDNVQIAKGGHWPTLDLNANYGNNANDIDNIANPAFSGKGDQTRTTFGVGFNLPIYQGGGVSARVQEQVYLHRAARENYERVARETERETRDAYLGVIAEIARVQALARAEDSNKTALEATEAGYEVGTRTTVDVLNSRQSLFLTQTQYARAKYDYLINVLRLKDAAGTLQAGDIQKVDKWLVQQKELAPIPGRGSQPDTDLKPGTPTSGGILDMPEGQEPAAEPESTE